MNSATDDSLGDAKKHLLAILTAGPDLHPYIPLLTRAVDISSATRIAITDCIFVALAEREGCEYVTADERVMKNLPGYPIVSLDSI